MGGCSRKRDVLVDEYNDMENKPNGSVSTETQVTTPNQTYVHSINSEHSRTLSHFQHTGLAWIGCRFSVMLT